MITSVAMEKGRDIAGPYDMERFKRVLLNRKNTAYRFGYGDSAGGIQTKPENSFYAPEN
jgi:hypothetical protein